MMKNNKKLSSLFKLFFIVLWIAINNSLTAQWFQQESGTDSHLNSVFFLDSLNGWVAGDSTILKTTNGGTDWISIPSGFSYDYNDVFFVSNSVGWVVGINGYLGIILYTSNAGQTWEKHSDGNMRGLHSVTFVNDSLGFIAGGISFPGWGIILKTVDRGVKWDTSYIFLDPDGHNFYDIDFINPNVGWAVGGIPGWQNIIMKTTDGGENWITQVEDTAHFEPFSSCDFISEEEGWVTFSVVGHIPYFETYAILYTQDGGENWSVQDLPDTSSFYVLTSIFFIDGKKGWCAGGNLSNDTADIYYTTDSGNTWMEQLISIQQQQGFNSIYFINEYVGWAVGQDGLILKTTNGGVTFIEEEEIDEIPTNYSITQNYPNPFNPNTTIRYSVPKSSNVIIKVFDILGNEIETLINGKKPVGTYELTWYGDNLPSGIYFYRLQAGSFVETKKMVLMK